MVGARQWPRRRDPSTGTDLPQRTWGMMFNPPTAAATRRGTRLLVCACIMLGTSGCGGSQVANVTGAVLAPYDAIAAHRAAAFCTAFTPRVRDQITHSVINARNCAAAVGSVFEKARDLSMWRTMPEQIKVTNITTMRGEMATATIIYPDGAPRTRVTVERVEGFWRVATQPIVGDIDGCFPVQRHVRCHADRRLWFFMGDHAGYSRNLALAAHR
jgi:hypothetical protein